MKVDDTLQKNPQVSRQALEELHQQLYTWALSRCDFDRAAAEDLMQQAYVEVLSGRARFDDKSTLRTFMFSIVQKLASSQRRKFAVRLRIVEQNRTELAQSEVLESDDGSNDHDRVWRAVAKLPARQRDITELVFCRDITVEEASLIMGVSVGTGRIHYDRAKKALAKRLADFE
jgi:RNA polymerase sigma-70 factor (ECF subfamily)